MKVGRAVTGGLAVVALLVLPACGGDDDDDDGATASADSTTTAETGEDSAEFAAYLGLTVEEAEAMAEDEGRPSRVVSEDGEDLPVTMDFVENRLNFTVEDGVVVEVTTG
jgi:hypothetical protein